VRFQRVGDALGQSTPFKNCRAGLTMNFYIAGMLANTQYSMRHDIVTGPRVTTSSPLPFTTRTPTGISFPTTVVDPADAPSSLQHPVVLFASGHATNVSGQIIWYLPGAGVVRPVPGGTFLTTFNADSTDTYQRLIREYDLAGNIVRETNVGRVSEQLIAMGKRPIQAFHHEVFRMPNGRTVVLCGNERFLPGVQNPAPPSGYIQGDAIAVLDQNLQVVWTWDAFEKMDVTREAVLNETCAPNQGGCNPLTPPHTVANDWLHSNSVALTPDGNFVISMRHQDWVVKINYANGTGNGDVIWRLGRFGDFTFQSSDPFPWFSHQHDAEFDSGDPQLMSIYDNGNTRRTLIPTANSRGQLLRINEANRTVTLPINADLGHYALAVGSAQRLLNGNYHFHSGFIDVAYSQAVETAPNGASVFRLQHQSTIYRSFRMKDLYTP
jgi:hypothetical protein